MPGLSNVRHRCRNPRCGCKLKEPTDNPRNAFCCRGCWEQYHHHRCVVCEQKLERKAGNQRMCGRRKCRAEIRQFPAVYAPFEGHKLPPIGKRKADARNPIKSGLKTGSKGDRPRRLVAGPPSSPTSFRLATLPLDPELAARLARHHADYVEYRRKAKRRAQLKAIIKRHHSPVDVLGGYRFPGAPAIDLSSIEAPTTQWAIASRWVPTGAGEDVPDIPEFLRRERPVATKLAA